MQELREVKGVSLRASILMVCLPVVGCSDSDNAALPAKSLKSEQNTVAHKISIKEFSTGQIASEELKSASFISSSWSYLSKVRVVKYEVLNNNVVVELKFDLKNSQEASDIRDGLVAKFRGEGSPGFSFDCVSKDGSVNFSDKTFAVIDESCYAFDDKQTLLIKSRSPKRTEPMVNQFPILNLFLNTGSVTLYDQSLRAVKSDEELIRVNEKIAQDNKEAIRAKKDM